MNDKQIEQLVQLKKDIEHFGRIVKCFESINPNMKIQLYFNGYYVDITEIFGLSIQITDICAEAFTDRFMELKYKLNELSLCLTKNNTTYIPIETIE